jgi:ryanodine receptor 2
MKPNRGPAKSAYPPNTIDTSQIELSSDLEELTKHLAENIHDNWARKRIDQGWR